MYVLKTWVQRGGECIEVQKTYTRRQGRRYGRGVNISVTGEAQARYNDKLSKRELTRIINENFTVDDIHLVLTYRIEDRPQNDEEFKGDLKKFLRLLRKTYKRAEIELKYITVSAIGKKGAPHHHLIITGIDLRQLIGLWDKGKIIPTFLYSKADYSKLAEYFIGQSNEEGGRIVGRRWSCSRNVVHPKMKKSEVDADVWNEPPKALPGYEIDYDTAEYGVNPHTGIPFCYYRMYRREIKKPIMTPDGRLLKPDAADRWLRKQEYLAEKAKFDENLKLRRLE